ncbi:MAG: SHOCT domain-containing protein [Proteobacteria bacterium]|nr:SHOCT domain-containing protein [Pseudomonadota bacterium]MBU4468857.1 SHOCT domain-containing protein [Pseudomonadota bacterium]MCG2750850.1 SHOCT domain-containing protein [Desulfobacteraceae bacterium]
MMGYKKKNTKEGLFQGVLLAYFILILHVILIAGLGFLVFLFSGVINYMGWILLFGTVAVLGSGYYFYRRMKKEGKNLKEMIRVPLLSGKSIEVSLLGGLASFKVGPAVDRPLLPNGESYSTPLIEGASRSDFQELKELARLFQEGLITRDEFDLAKQKLFAK